MIKYIITIFIFSSIIVKSQTCGFGCLGLSSVYGGYSFHKYDAGVLNSIINDKIQSTSKIDFGKSQGVLVGSNIFRARFKGVFLTAKGYYQFLKEKKNVDYTPDNMVAFDKQYEYQLEMDHWGFGIDLGVPITNFFDLKIIDGGIAIFNVDLYERDNINTKNTNEVEYESNSDIGYFVGSGVIFHIVENYVSLEGSAHYNFFSIREMERTSDEFKLKMEDRDLITNKGISYTVQLNIGIPL